MDVPVGTLAGKDARAHGDKRSHSFAYRYKAIKPHAKAFITHVCYSFFTRYRPLFRKHNSRHQDLRAPLLFLVPPAVFPKRDR